MGSFGGLETGGTWIVAAVGRGPDELDALERFPTTTPAETVAACAAFFAAHGPIERLGIGSFGPVDLDPGSPTWGNVTSTPKPGWSDAPLAGPLRDALGVEVVFDTDVNAAAVGEHRWGAGRGADPFVYITVGTGIGGGVLAGGRPVHGAMHPELGHIRVPHDTARDPFPGTCPFHGDCLEGLACGPAIAARWGVPGSELPDDHPAWALEASYLAHGVVALACVLSPPVVVLSGGVGRRPGMRDAVAAEVDRLLAGYLPAPALREPELGDRAGVLGALALAMGDQASSSIA
jgi:fructokinase